MSLRQPICGALLLWLVAMVGGTTGAPAAPVRPQLLVNDRAVEVTVARVTTDGEILVEAKGLESIGLASLSWRAETRSAIMEAGSVTVEFRPGSKTADITVTPRTGNPIRQEEPLPHPAVLSEGRLVVPLFFLCRKLGITAEFRPPAVVNLQLPERAAAEGGDTADSAGVIVGRVLFGGRPLSGAVLRLVRDSDSTFVPGRKASTDGIGRYRFAGVPSGRYRVYSYVGDNPDYFNRETPAFLVTDGEVVAPTISMGRIIRPVQPLPEARLPFAERLHFEWTPCPGAADYEFTVIDPEIHEEVAFEAVQSPRAEIPGGALALGRHYQCRVLALNESGDFLGATPGMGVPPWSIMVVAYAESDSSTNAGKEN